jgi:zinc D-Ala-D-Ala carboxypeptidase
MRSASSDSNVRGASVRATRLLLALLLATGGSMTLTATSLGSAAFSDTATSIYRHDIDWLAARGITRGCDEGRYCPDALVSREQMASFLVRMFQIPPAAHDAFDDDDESQHEPAINALAASGVTGGCRIGGFCPRAPVTREQMAAFLARASRLPSTAADHFLDDDGSPHRGAIDRAAAAGVTGGCGAFVFCPRARVTRGQMAAFLHRVEDPGAAPTPLPDVGPLPACRYDDVLTTRRTVDDWPTTLLDTIFMVPRDYVPPDLIDTASAGANGGYAIRAIAGADLAALVRAAAAAGRPIRLVSAYRSYATQERLFADYVARYGMEVALRRSARPGHSEHQLGTTIDVTHLGGAAPWSYADWAAHPTGAWMRDHAWRFGFVMSYPKGRESRHCYDYEPWHYRYVGREHAANVRLSGLTLREWIWRRFGP